MRRLSESIFNAGVERNQGNEIKKEDEFELNIYELKCGVCVDGVYWANHQLTVNDGYEISINTFNSIKNYQLKGWRLPTRKEFERLIEKTHIYSGSWCDSKAFEKPGKEGPFVDLCSVELMQIQKENGFNAINYDENGEIQLHTIDENAIMVEDWNVVVQLVRDNKI